MRKEQTPCESLLQERAAELGLSRGKDPAAVSDQGELFELIARAEQGHIAKAGACSGGVNDGFGQSGLIRGGVNRVGAAQQRREALLGQQISAVCIQP